MLSNKQQQIHLTVRQLWIGRGRIQLLLTCFIYSALKSSFELQQYHATHRANSKEQFKLWFLCSYRTFKIYIKDRYEIERYDILSQRRKLQMSLLYIGL